MDPQVGTKRNNALTSLIRRIYADDTSIPVYSTAPFLDSGRINVSGEKVRYTSKTPQAFEGCIRGVDLAEGGDDRKVHQGGDLVWQDEPSGAALIHDAAAVVRRNALALYEGPGIDISLIDNPLTEQSEVTVSGFTLDHGHIASDDGGSLHADADLLSVDAFTAVASVIIDSRNIGSGDLFQSDYDHYEIIVHLTALSSTTAVNFNFRLRAGGTDSGATAHFSQRTSGQAGSATPVGVAFSGTAQCVCGVVTSTAQHATWDLKLWGPNTTLTAKRFNSQFSWSAADSGHGIAGGQISSATQFTGIKFLPDSMNLTGVAYTYGLRKAA
jgi:hypothetical protein